MNSGRPDQFDDLHGETVGDLLKGVFKAVG